MLTRSLISLLVALAVVLPSSTALAQTSIGVDEKLGDEVPLDLTFHDEDANPITLREAGRGKPIFLVLVFYRCQGICTPFLNGLADAIKRSPEIEPYRDFQIVTVSFDPEDTPAVARGKRNSYLKLLDRPVDPRGWRFLTGNQDQIDKLTDAVGFRYVEQGGTFVHTGVIAVLSAEGKIVRYLYGGEVIRNMMPVLPFELQMALVEASEGRVGTTVHRVLRLCFQYDQEGKRYVLSVTRISMVLVMLFAGALLLYVIFFAKVGRPDDSNKGA